MLTQDELQTDGGRSPEKNSIFAGWIVGGMALVLYVRKCKAQTAGSMQNHRVAQDGALW
jgi:hypothetical protein